MNVNRTAVTFAGMLLAGTLALSCRQGLDESRSRELTASELAASLPVHTARLPLFADLGGYMSGCATRSGVQTKQDTVVSMAELLNETGKETLVFRGLEVTAVPFKRECTAGNLALTARHHDMMSVDSLSMSKIFLVATKDVSTGETDYCVATMIPDVRFLECFCYDDVSFVDKSKFFGAVLYSELDGTFIDGGYYRWDLPVCELTPVKPGESCGDKTSVRLSVLSDGETEQTHTKTGFEYVYYKNAETEMNVYRDILHILGVRDTSKDVDETTHMIAANAAGWADLACVGEVYDDKRFTITVSE